LLRTLPGRLGIKRQALEQLLALRDADPTTLETRALRTHEEPAHAH
jgi:hypothetical protein